MEPIKQKLTFPKTLGGGEVTIKTLSVEEQLSISDAHMGKFSRAADESAKRCVVELRGTKIDASNREESWAALSPKERSLIRAAYGRLHNPTDAEEESFFASASLVVQS